MHFQLLTIFPEFFSQFKELGLMSRAIKDNIVKISSIDLREFAVNTQGQVDDTPYGGGSGMLLRPDVAVDAIQKAKSIDPSAKVVLLSPRGQVFKQDLARSLSVGGADDIEGKPSGLIFLCSRYEGLDERIREHWVDIEISIGDYILMGGETAAMVIMEGITRLLPGVLGNTDSIEDESFSNGLLEYPQYTKPQSFRGYEVPEILLSGHHRNIQNWRNSKAEEETIKQRPDLLSCDENSDFELSIALIHHPVLDKNNEIITSSITNFDLHDIARSSRTFGISKFYIVHPTKTLRRLSEKICEHWDTGYGASYNPNRRDAFSLVSVVPSLDDVLFDIEARTGSFPELISTSAKASSETTTFLEMKNIIKTSKNSYLLVLGTGWGLTEEMHKRAKYTLEPVLACSDYNHLSVRAAAAIMLDRLLGLRPTGM